MCMCVHVSACVLIPGVPGWYVLTATLGMPRMWEVERRSEVLRGHAPDGRSRFSNWLVPGGRSAVGVLSLLWRKVEGQLPPELSFPALARRGSSSLDESNEVKAKPFFLQEFFKWTEQKALLLKSIDLSRFFSFDYIHALCTNIIQNLRVSKSKYLILLEVHRVIQAHVVPGQRFRLCYHQIILLLSVSLFSCRCFSDVSLSNRAV